MRKVLVGLFIGGLALAFCGCEAVTKGDYKEGTYFGYAYDSQYDTYATAVVYVNESGVIKSVFIDSTYINTSKSATTASTKKVEGKDYNMKIYNQAAAGEWYEQANKVEEYVISNQGLDIKLDSEGKTDAISGATINLTPTVEAVNNALKQAK